MIGVTVLIGNVAVLGGDIASSGVGVMIVMLTDAYQYDSQGLPRIPILSENMNLYWISHQDGR